MAKMIYRPFKYLSKKEDVIGAGGTNGGIVVGNQLWMVTGSFDDHQTMNGTIEIRDKKSYTLLKKLDHNLGHGNGIDCRNDELLFYSENEGIKELSLYSDPDQQSELKVDDVDNTLIVLDDVKPDGSACFADDANHVFHAARGMSDDIWISYLSIDRANKSSQVIWQRNYLVTPDMQPQDMFYDSSQHQLHVGAGQKIIKDYVFEAVVKGNSLADVKLRSIVLPTNSFGWQEIESLLLVDNRLIIRSGKNGILNIGTVDWFNTEKE